MMCFWARDEGKRSGERDDVDVRRREEEEERIAKEKVDGGDTGGNGYEPGGAERSAEKPKRVEDADSWR